MISDAKAQVGARPDQGTGRPAAFRRPVVRRPSTGTSRRSGPPCPRIRSGHVAYTPPASEADLSAGFKAMYDDAGPLHPRGRHRRRICVSDSVGVLAGRQRRALHRRRQQQVRRVRRQRLSVPLPLGRHGSRAWARPPTTRPTASSTPSPRTDKGYRLEAQFPWSTLGITPGAGDDDRPGRPGQRRRRRRRS